MSFMNKYLLLSVLCIFSFFNGSAQVDQIGIDTSFLRDCDQKIEVLKAYIKSIGEKDGDKLKTKAQQDKHDNIKEVEINEVLEIFKKEHRNTNDTLLNPTIQVSNLKDGKETRFRLSARSYFNRLLNLPHYSVRIDFGIIPKRKRVERIKLLEIKKDGTKVYSVSGRYEQEFQAKNKLGNTTYGDITIKEVVVEVKKSPNELGVETIIVKIERVDVLETLELPKSKRK